MERARARRGGGRGGGCGESPARTLHPAPRCKSDGGSVPEDMRCCCGPPSVSPPPTPRPAPHARPHASTVSVPHSLLGLQRHGGRATAQGRHTPHHVYGFHCFPAFSHDTLETKNKPCQNKNSYKALSRHRTLKSVYLKKNNDDKKPKDQFGRNLLRSVTNFRKQTFYISHSSHYKKPLQYCIWLVKLIFRQISTIPGVKT